MFFLLSRILLKLIVDKWKKHEKQKIPAEHTLKTKLDQESLIITFCEDDIYPQSYFSSFPVFKYYLKKASI